PPYITAMRSDRASTSARSADTRRIALPASRAARRRAWMNSIAPTSTPRAGGQRRVGGADVEGLDLPPRVGGDALVVEPRSPHISVLLAKYEIFGDRVIQYESAKMAVLGDVRQPGVAPRPHGLARGVAAGDVDRAALHGAQSGNGL